MDSIHNLSRLVYATPADKNVRPYLLKYIRYYANQAAQLSTDELLYEKGSEYASNICGAIAWQGAVNTPSDSWITDWINRGISLPHDAAPTSSGWITQDGEPVLWSIFEIVSSLDIDGNNVDQWHELFQLVDKL